MTKRSYESIEKEMLDLRAGSYKMGQELTQLRKENAELKEEMRLIENENVQLRESIIRNFTQG